MLPVKAAFALVEITVASVLATSSVFDGTADRLVLYSAAAAGVAWLWRNVLRPVAKVLHRMAEAVEALEDLPAWRRKTGQRIKHLEFGMGHIASGQQAILRELGIEDKVRQQFTDPEALERWLNDFGTENDGPS